MRQVTFFALGLTLIAGTADAQSIRLGPGGIEITPGPEVEVVQPPPPPPRAPIQRDELRVRLMELREACEDGDRRSCVRFGIIIGENRERRAQWRRENPDFFFYER